MMVAEKTMLLKLYYNCPKFRSGLEKLALIFSAPPGFASFRSQAQDRTPSLFSQQPFGKHLLDKPDVRTLVVAEYDDRDTIIRVVNQNR